MSSILFVNNTDRDFANNSQTIYKSLATEFLKLGVIQNINEITSTTIRVFNNFVIKQKYVDRDKILARISIYRNAKLKQENTVIDDLAVVSDAQDGTNHVYHLLENGLPGKAYNNF